MDYSKMSDKEINIAVSIALGAKEVVPDLYISDDRRFDFDLPKRGKPGKFFFDPCNSWSDAGPIIEKFGIGLMPFKKSPAKAWPLSVGLLSNASVEHENPLRAAMIVCLMMHDKGGE